jgi:hypothetical protein
MKCYNCDQIIIDGDALWGEDEPYCESCFNDHYTYCTNCDTTVLRRNALFSDSGNAYCIDCYPEDDSDDDYDEDNDAPVNPHVTESDRDLIIRLARGWLVGSNEHRRPIQINVKDTNLKLIKDKVGLVDLPVYLFGLTDREDYQISTSENIYEDVKEYITSNNFPALMMKAAGHNRLGVSLSLRVKSNPFY